MNIDFEFNPTEDTTVGIFDRRFLVRIPTIATIPEWELEEFGVLNTPGIDVPTHLQQDMTARYTTIAEMTVVRNRGFKIEVPNPDDIIEIYDAISKHLYAWKVHLETSLNTRKPPMDDLVELDDFATEIFNLNKHRIAGKQDIAAFKTPMERSGLGRILNRFKPHEEQTNLSEVERNSITDDIVSQFSVNDITFGNI